MNIITLDFETYYANDFSLTKYTTEEYIRDPQFQVIGVGIKSGKGEIVWYTGSHEQIKQHLKSYDWENSALLCHNTAFDGAILAWHFGITPLVYLDTLSMARAIHGVDAGGSLAALVKRYELGEKGTEVINAKGMRAEAFTPEELDRYGEYCKNDVWLTYLLYQKLGGSFPLDELKLIDLTLRMFIHPVLEVDDALLVDRLETIREEKLELLGGLMNRLDCKNEEEVRKKLASNKQFAELLTEIGVPPPMKESPTTGKQTYALAKNDVGFIELLEGEDPFIQQLCAVRLGTKSTLEESRISRFINIGARNKGRLPIPLKYYGAHTGRWAGSDKVNFQNLPSRDKKKKSLKNSVLAPDGHYIVNSDSSQIEARILVWWAGQHDVVEQFRNGEDVYSLFASKVYEKTITKANETERFVGKTCVLGLGFGTGALKLQHTLQTQPPGAILSEDECKRLVSVYRDVNHKVVELWDKCDKALADIASWPTNKEPYYLGENKCVLITKDGIKLPNGLYITYPELKWDTSSGRGRFTYMSRKGPISIWGGAMVENVVQALARIVVGIQMLNICDTLGYRIALTVHDAAVVVVPENEIDSARDGITKIMSTAPDWATTLPLACETKYGRSYGEC